MLLVKELTEQMEAAAEALDFETAAKYRDTLKDVQQAHYNTEHG